MLTVTEPMPYEDREDQWLGVSVSSQHGAKDGNGKAVVGQGHWCNSAI